MTDRPIIFSAPMVQALIEGRKTQTRRILKKGCPASRNLILPDGPNKGAVQLNYAPGNRLWVKETHARYPEGDLCLPHYMADGPIPSISDRHDAGLLIKYPAIFMPRWASRLTLAVTDVRVQRLQDITEDDAQAEGLVQAYEGWATDTQGRCWGPTARDSFVQLFDSLHGTHAWGKNPWVVALTFDVHRGNIDEVQP